MVKVAVLDDYDRSISKLECWNLLLPDFEIEFFSVPMDYKLLSKYEVIVAVRERTNITREFLNHAKNLKHLALTGRLSGQADLIALKEIGISVSYTEGSGSAAAEQTMALILGVTKQIHKRHWEVNSGGWQNGLGVSLSGKTLAILGLGRIGSKVATLGKLLDMNVISWGPTPDQGRSEKLGLMRLDLRDCLKQADVISICLRLSDQTRGLLGKDELSLVRDGTCLVNTARAEIIGKEALYSELATGRIYGAFDVFHTEPLPDDDQIRSFPNVLLSPHMGYVTREVYQIFFSQVVENILAWKNGRKFKDALLS